MQSESEGEKEEREERLTGEKIQNVVLQPKKSSDMKL